MRCSSWGCRAARSPATSITSSIRRRSSFSRARIRFRRPTPRSAARTSSGPPSRRSWSHRSPFSLPASRTSSWCARARVLRARTLARRRARLARVRCGRALAGARQRDARLAPDTGDRRVAGSCLEVEGRRAVPGVLVGLRDRDQVLRVAARHLASCDPPLARSCPRGDGRGRVTPPRAAVHVAPRLRARALACAERSSGTRATTSSDCSSRQARATASLRRCSVVVGLALLAGVWRYQSFALAVGAALVLSPIAWLDYYALAALPLAVVRPRLSAIWFLPLVTWGLQGAGMSIGDVPSTLPPATRLRSRARSCIQGRASAPARSRQRWHDTGTAPRVGATRARGRAVDRRSSSASRPSPTRAGWRSTSTKRSIRRPRRSSMAVIRIRIPAAAITDTANAIWPIAAVLPAVPLTAVSDACGRLDRDLLRARLSRRRVVDAGHSRLAYLRGDPPLAVGDRRVPDGERDPAADAARWRSCGGIGIAVQSAGHRARAWRWR